MTINKTVNGVITYFILGLSASLLSAGNLDAPLANEVITVRSEIERGLSSAPDPVLVPIRNYSEAVTMIAKANLRKDANTPAFEFGLYYASWHHLWSCLSSGMYKGDQQQRQAAIDADYFQLLAHLFRKGLDVTDAELKALAPTVYIEDEDECWPELVKSRAFHPVRHRNGHD